ncbi:hypothetical protein MSAN_02260900 [Mycena sanguinolenta]|uniref:Uncharacterized protein n=1 Tax=Mycena sanguinolenta TaxID=230812 RepID=A0A8H6XB72_9AGAR|nr:hypothetical protein MSAN_02260900 [Mycena sanguinolenta]
MTLASEDDIDNFGLDEFSTDFLEELERAEEAFPSSFGPIPPSSQEMHDALDTMEQPDFTFSQCKTQPVTRRSPSPFPFPTCAQPSSASVPTLRISDWECSTASRRVCVKPEPISPTLSSPPASPLRNVSNRKRARSPATEGLPFNCKKHKPSPPTVTHLSQFFSAYPKYEYDPSGPASQQFQELRRVYKASQNDTAGIDAGYNRALGLTFSEMYGDDVNSLENWQRLCRVVEINPIPESLQECQFAIEDAHVNLIDLVDIRTTGAPVHRFATEKALSVYTKSTGKIFPRREAYKGRLLRHLLRRIFRPPPENMMRRGGVLVKREW